ncbi:hypothetical protein [Sphingobacterium sp. UBA7625]|uniref:hypothetical protein n=1 Tax=Sphingobacterium sp. UBA7625 TaxID=1947522 RepID=UPI00257E1802|nr:hypothetical protein [Sphingobacterium sp. UBA7625]
MESQLTPIEKPHKKILEKGIFTVTLVAIVGSLLSRWLKIDYSWFSIISIIIYIGLAYLIGLKQNLKTTLWSIIKLGLYDSVVGLLLSLWLEANFSGFEKKLYQYGIIGWMFIIILQIACSIILGLIGYGIAMKKNSNKNPTS